MSYLIHQPVLSEIAPCSVFLDIEDDYDPFTEPDLQATGLTDAEAAELTKLYKLSDLQSKILDRLQECLPLTQEDIAYVSQFDEDFVTRNARGEITKRGLSRGSILQIERAAMERLRFKMQIMGLDYSNLSIDTIYNHNSQD
jgi:hypothetical protein